MSEDKDTSLKGGIWAAPLVWLVRGYQLFLSPLLPSSCRFYPSCSAYALTALRRFGPVRGSWLAARRLGRCHPWNLGGVDHVPRRGPNGRPIRDNEWRWSAQHARPVPPAAAIGRSGKIETGGSGRLASCADPGR